MPLFTLIPEALQIVGIQKTPFMDIITGKAAAQVLEARDAAGLAYDMAKRVGRLEKARQAHDSVIAAMHRAQADALEIESRAKRRLADEYDAAHDRGEVATQRDGKRVGLLKEKAKPTTADIGITHKQIHQARKVRAAEKADPGIVKRTVDGVRIKTG